MKSQAYKEGAAAAALTPWISLRGKPDDFRQGFYAKSVDIRLTATHRIIAEKKTSRGNWAPFAADTVKAFAAKAARTMKASDSFRGVSVVVLEPK